MVKAVVTALLVLTMVAVGNGARPVRTATTARKMEQIS